MKGLLAQLWRAVVSGSGRLGVGPRWRRGGRECEEYLARNSLKFLNEGVVLRQCDGSRRHSRMWYPNTAKQRAGQWIAQYPRWGWPPSRLYAFLNGRKPTIIPLICLQRAMSLAALCSRREDLVRWFDPRLTDETSPRWCDRIQTSCFHVTATAGPLGLGRPPRFSPLISALMESLFYPLAPTMHDLPDPRRWLADPSGRLEHHGHSRLVHTHASIPRAGESKCQLVEPGEQIRKKKL